MEDSLPLGHYFATDGKPWRKLPAIADIWFVIPYFRISVSPSISIQFKNRRETIMVQASFANLW
jgi:hypothetical protein